MNSIAAIKATNISKSFHVSKSQTIHAVRDVSFTIEPGEIIALLGPNGAGKTTTIDMMLGLSQPDSGTVRLYGMSSQEAISRGLIGVILQTDSLMTSWTVHQLLSYLASTYGMHRPLKEVMAEAEITELANQKVGRCSGGQIQRIRLAIALLPDPLLLVLDEPTAGMDVNARKKFWELMRKQADAGRTILFATHYLEEAEAFANRTIIFNEGQIVADEATSTLRARTLTQHLKARIPTEHFPAVTEQLRQLQQGKQWSITHEAGLLKIEGKGLEPAALLVLQTPGTTEFEMYSATLEDTFRSLTNSTQLSEPEIAPGV